MGQLLVRKLKFLHIRDQQVKVPQKIEKIKLLAQFKFLSIN